MATDIWREFDPRLPIPIGLKNARVKELLDDEFAVSEPNEDIDWQEGLDNEDSEIDDDQIDEELDVPGSFEILSQTIRTAPDGSQVVDVVIDVEEVEGAVKYEVRITK